MIVYISRFGHDEIELDLREGATVAEALRAGGVELTGREEAFVSGVKATQSAILEDGDVLSIVTPKQAGAHALAGAV